jgi:hypothetical protein
VKQKSPNCKAVWRLSCEFPNNYFVFKEVTLVRDSKNLKVEQGKRKVKRVVDDWSEDAGKNPDDLEIYDQEDT